MNTTIETHSHELWVCSSEAKIEQIQAILDMPQVELHTKVKEMLASKGMQVSAEDADLEDMLPPMYDLQGDVGVVRVEGSLIPGQAGLYRFFGMVGYEDIINAAVQALGDKKAKSIMLHVSSPGGSVRGVNEAAKTLRTIGTLKPMNVYADLAASGGYWLAAAGGHITLDEVAIAGSIGVITTLTNYSEAYKKAGIEKTVLRAGKYKTLANGNEPLSEEAKAEVQGQLNYIYDMFASSVAQDRGTTITTVDQTMAQGREFIGKQALQAGLVDQIGTFSSAMEFSMELGKNAKKTSKTKSTASVNLGESATQQVAASLGVTHNGVNPTKEGTQTMPFTAEQLAAIAEGEAQAHAQAAAAGSASVQVGGEGSSEAADTQEVQAAAVKTAEVLAAEVSSLSENLQLAKAEAEQVNAKLAQQTASLEALSAEHDKLKVAAQKLSEIVQSQVKTMSIALGKAEPEAKDAEAVLQVFAQVSEDFKSNFKVGGASRSTMAAKETTEPAKVNIDPMLAYRINSFKTKE